LGPRARRAIEDALKDIEDDPSPTAPQRHAGQGRHEGRIVDLSVRGYAIVYRIADLGAVVEVSAIFPVNY